MRQATVRVDFAPSCPYLFRSRRSGGIGRRAAFRAQWAYARGGSSPPFGMQGNGRYAKAVARSFIRRGSRRRSSYAAPSAIRPCIARASRPRARRSRGARPRGVPRTRAARGPAARRFPPRATNHALRGRCAASSPTTSHPRPTSSRRRSRSPARRSRTGQGACSFPSR